MHADESYHGSFERSFYLPGTIKSEKIDAQYKDGILTLTLPKVEKKAKADRRKKSVKTSGFKHNYNKR